MTFIIYYCKKCY